MLRLFIITKEQAFHICDKSQYFESTLWEKTKLNFRYTWCPATRHYVDRNRKLTEAIKSSNLKCLHHSERKIMADYLNDHLKNQVQNEPSYRHTFHPKRTVIIASIFFGKYDKQHGYKRYRKGQKHYFRCQFRF